MDGRSVLTCMTIALLAAAMAPAGTANAQGDDGGIKGGFKSGISQAVDPSERVNEAFDEAESQICDPDRHSLACKVIVIIGTGVAVIFIVRYADGLAGLIRR